MLRKLLKIRMAGAEMKENITFEDALKRLEEIVSKLELGEVPLDESLKLFEEGVKLTNFCNKQIENAEKKITMFVKNSDGNIVEESFETGDSIE